MFKEQLGHNVNAYVDNMIFKSHVVTNHYSNLEEMFETLRRYQIKLNPKKCAFGVQLGKFLGFMITHKGIKTNPKKVQAILNIAPPKTLHEV